VTGFRARVESGRIPVEQADGPIPDVLRGAGSAMVLIGVALPVLSALIWMFVKAGGSFTNCS
jgi:hypothetical protein